MEMRVQVLHSGVVAMGGVLHGVEVVKQGATRMRCGSKKLWLKFALLTRRTSDPCTPF